MILLPEKNIHPRKMNLKPCNRFLKPLVLIVMIMAVNIIYGQQHDTILPTTTSDTPKPGFRKLWRNQAYLNLGILGYRTVSETDVFRVRQFNPNGSDLIRFEEIEVENRQNFYPILTTGGEIRRIFPLVQKKHFAIHAEVNGMLFLQRIFVPSVSDNTVNDSSHYPVRHYNMPSITNLSLSGGLWHNEQIGLGLRISRNTYSISTDDDRMEQKSLSTTNVVVNPYFSIWLPLEFTAMKRWFCRITIDGSIPDRNNSLYTVSSAELALFRLSKERTGRATGVFVRYVRSPETKNPVKYPLYKISDDSQFIIGVSIGTGGLNRRRGR